MLGLPIGLVYANAMEWVIHKYMLHGRGRDKKSFWSFHWHDHHQTVRKNDMFDDAYNEPLFVWGPKSKEIVALVGGALVHAPLLPVAPFYVTGVWLSAANYYRVHRKAHLDPAWAKEHLPWHVDHHMGPNQHANWCVSYPLWDYVMGTREKYLGTEKHRDDLAREKARTQTSTSSSEPPLSAVPQAA